jgi:hypothetical protein
LYRDENILWFMMHRITYHHPIIMYVDTYKPGLCSMRRGVSVSRVKPKICVETW